MHKCIILFFPQHIPRFIAASYKEEHLNRAKKFKLSGNTYFYQNLQIIKKRVSYADSAFSKTEKEPLKLFLASRQNYF